MHVLQTLFLDIMAEEALATLMKQLQKEMKIVLQGQQETALRMARSAQKDNYSFKRRWNELQFRFNEELAEKVEAAKAIQVMVVIQWSTACILHMVTGYLMRQSSVQHGGNWLQWVEF